MHYAHFYYTVISTPTTKVCTNHSSTVDCIKVELSQAGTHFA